MDCIYSSSAILIINVTVHDSCVPSFFIRGNGAKAGTEMHFHLKPNIGAVGCSSLPLWWIIRRWWIIWMVFQNVSTLMGSSHPRCYNVCTLKCFKTSVLSTINRTSTYYEILGSWKYVWMPLIFNYKFLTKLDYSPTVLWNFEWVDYPYRALINTDKFAS